jgi:hypothetical protein
VWTRPGPPSSIRQADEEQNRIYYEPVASRATLVTGTDAWRAVEELAYAEAAARPGTKDNATDFVGVETIRSNNRLRDLNKAR